MCERKVILSLPGSGEMEEKLRGSSPETRGWGERSESACPAQPASAGHRQMLLHLSLSPTGYWKGHIFVSDLCLQERLLSAHLLLLRRKEEGDGIDSEKLSVHDLLRDNWRKPLGREMIFCY